MEQNIPVIDINSLLQIEADHLAFNQTIQEIHAACITFGFFYVKNHGISKKLTTDLLKIGKVFFSQTLEEKLKIDMNLGGSAWRGYVPVGRELTSDKADLKEAIYFGREEKLSNQLPLFGPNLFCQNTPSMKQVVLEYLEKIEDLCQKLLKGIFLGVLGVKYEDKVEEICSESFNDPMILFRIFSYPHLDSSAGKAQWGVGEHTDYGFLTILLQDHIGGLQVKLRSSQTWVDIPSRDDCFVVNIGDMLEYWTRGVYQATPHRVSNKGKVNRISCPFFFDPGFHSKLHQIDKELIKANDLELAKMNKNKRWDGLQGLDPDELNISCYGEYLWQKVSRVFPDLAAKVSRGLQK